MKKIIALALSACLLSASAEAKIKFDIANTVKSALETIKEVGGTALEKLDEAAGIKQEFTIGTGDEAAVKYLGEKVNNSKEQIEQAQAKAAAAQKKTAVAKEIKALEGEKKQVEAGYEQSIRALQTRIEAQTKAADDNTAILSQQLALAKDAQEKANIEISIAQNAGSKKILAEELAVNTQTLTEEKNAKVTEIEKKLKELKSQALENAATGLAAKASSIFDANPDSVPNSEAVVKEMYLKEGEADTSATKARVRVARNSVAFEDNLNALALAAKTPLGLDPALEKAEKIAEGVSVQEGTMDAVSLTSDLTAEEMHMIINLLKLKIADLKADTSFELSIDENPQFQDLKSNMSVLNLCKYKLKKDKTGAGK